MLLKCSKLVSLIGLNKKEEISMKITMDCGRSLRRARLLRNLLQKRMLMLLLKVKFLVSLKNFLVGNLRTLVIRKKLKSLLLKWLRQFWLKKKNY